MKTAWSFTSTAAMCPHAMKPKHENNLLFLNALTELVHLCYICYCLSNLTQPEHFQHLPLYIDRNLQTVLLEPWEERIIF